MSDESIFAAALGKPPGAERSAFLDGACGSDHALRRRIERLLEADDQTGGILERGPDVGPTDAPSPDGPPLLADRVFAGRFKLRQKLGEGGMGEVWVADQAAPVQRRVAIKVVRPGLDSERMLARFDQERQALALMDHPNIAKVLDAGEAEGRPYFVMELIKGVPITDYCDRARLSPRERLALFVPVCEAVQHAHQKSVVHRDLKPSNILVALYDGRPVPKVIDFGIAKATGPRLTDRSIYTEVGALIGTLEYMAPEQAELNNLDIDTRADVYALGAILYELLTGSVPFSRQELQAAGFLEMLRVIREVEPPRPSTKLSKSGTLPSVADVRRTDPQKLVSLMRGELDWIILKCLEKDRGRRYQAASGLARDLEHYLADEPVEACPPTASYRLRKFARKYKKALATAAAFAVLLVVGAVMSTLLAVWATSNQREAYRQRSIADAASQAAARAKVEADKERDEARLNAYATGIGLAQRAWDEGNVVRARELLEEVPKEVAGKDLRGFEWYYLSRLCRSEALTLKGHGDGVWSIAFSPDGNRLASASHDETVKIWDSTTGGELLALKGHTDRIGSVAFSPNGQRLASSSRDGTVRIWDSVAGKELLSLKGQADGGHFVVFSPDGKRLAAACSDNSVRIWDSVTGKELVSLKHPNSVASMMFSPDGQRLAAWCGDKTVRIWSSQTGKELVSSKAEVQRGFGVAAFSPDGQRLATAGNPHNKTVKIWDSATGEELHSLVGPGHWIRSVAFSPDGQRLAAGSLGNNTVTIWDSATGAELSSLKGHAGGVTSAAFSPDGKRLAAGSTDRTVKIWDSATDNELFTFKSHSDCVNSITFSPDGQRLASAEWGPTVSATGNELLALKGNARVVWSVAFSPDGKRLATGGAALPPAKGGGKALIWDSMTGKDLLSLTGRAIWSVAFSPDGNRLAAVSDDKRVIIWDSATGKELVSVARNSAGRTGSDWPTSVTFSPDGKRLAAGNFDDTVKIWDSTTGKELVSLKSRGDGITKVTFSPDGQRVAAGSTDNTVQIWDSAIGKELVSLNGHTNRITSVAFSPDGQRLASSSRDGTVRIWDSVAGKELLSLKGRGNQIMTVAFSPDGQCLAAGNIDGSIHRWETNVSPAVQERRKVVQLVADLYRQLALRADVLQRLQTGPGMTQSRREEALAVAQTYPEDPYELDLLARELIKLPGREMPDYQKALRFSEEACQIEPENGHYLNTLGVVYYRLGNDEKALDSLSRSDKINALQDDGSHPTDIAFLAMTHQQLGHAKEAQAELQRLRERMKDPRWAQDAQAHGFLREAEALLAKPNAPGSK